MCSIIEEHVIQSNVCISMKFIMEDRGIVQVQHQYWLKLKSRLTKTFGDKMLFLTPENDTQQVITIRNSLTGQPVSSTIKLSQENIVKKLLF